MENKRVDKTFFSKRWLSIIERTFLDPSIKEKTLSWIRTDLPEDPMLTYCIVFPKGHCIALRFGGYLLDPNNEVVIVPNLGFVTTFQIGVSTVPGHLIEKLRSFLLACYNNWLFEEKCIERINKIIKDRLSREVEFPLKSVMSASLHDDYYKSTDAKIIFKQQAIPLQIKSSNQSAKVHMEKNGHIPVLMYDPKITDHELLLAMIRICLDYEKK